LRCDSTVEKSSSQSEIAVDHATSVSDPAEFLSGTSGVESETKRTSFLEALETLALEIEELIQIAFMAGEST
jgi:hypothetical protein